MANEYPSVRDFITSWADIKIVMSVVDGSILEESGIEKIDWGETVEEGVVYGVGPRPMGRTLGQRKLEDVAITFSTYESFTALVTALGEKSVTRGNQKLISTATFDVLVSWTPVGTDRIDQCEIKGVRVKGVKFSAAAGTDPQKVECTCSCVDLAEIINGSKYCLL